MSVAQEMAQVGEGEGWSSDVQGEKDTLAETYSINTRITTTKNSNKTIM